MLLDFDLTNIYYCGIVVMAMSVSIKEKNIKVSDYSVFRKTKFIFLATTRRKLIVSGGIKMGVGMLHQIERLGILTNGVRWVLF